MKYIILITLVLYSFMAFSSQDNEIGDIQRLKDRIAQLEYTIDSNEMKRTTKNANHY